MFTNYQETVDYLYKVLPIFQRVGAAAYKADLTNTIALCESLGHPERKYKTIHIAGTNGKGSTSHLLASILQTAGYKTGLYTSPHLKNFTERVKVDGQEISREFVIDFVNRIKPLIEKISPSFFEITVALAFDYFVHQKVDVAVIEVGLGGRLDSTNVITPVLSVITNIGWDHTDLLGDTLEKIAVEKAGIIKNNVPVVVSERQAEVAHVFIDAAIRKNAPLHFASDHFNVEPGRHGEFLIFKENNLRKTISIPLKGYYQRKNLAGVMQAIDLLKNTGFDISDETLYSGMEKVIDRTGLKGRWQQLGTKPLMICDTGHNIDGVKEILNQLNEQSFNSLFIIWGMVKDKDIRPVLQLLPKQAYYFFCQAHIPRALDAYDLFEKAKEQGLKGEVIADVNEAIRQAASKATDEDMIFIGGSTFVVAEIDNL